MIATPTIPASIRFTAAAEYFRDYCSVSQSMLKVFMDRRRLYQAYYVDCSAEPPDPTPPMQKGTATHTALLEPERFAEMIVVYPASVLAKNGAVSTNEAKAFRDEHEAAGRAVLKYDDYRNVLAMAESVRRVCGKWLDLPGRKEQCVYWTDEITGLPCKARLDWLIERGDRNFVFDLKTTTDASPAAFRKRIEDGYWLQSDHYSAGVEAVTNRRTSFIFVAVENTFPYACALHELDADSISKAIDGRRRVLNNLAACLESGDFSEPWEKIISTIPVRDFAFNGNQL